MTYADGRYGALDIGTVTCRLLVADVEDGRIIDVDKEYAITDLGVGVDATGRLSEAAIERVLACVDRYLEVLARYDTPEHPVRRLIASTATSVVSIREAMEVYDSSRVHKAVVAAGELAAIEERLAAEPLEERKATVGLDPKRAGVIVAGFVILEEVLALAGADAYTASESDILHGMIFEAARED